MPTRLEQSQKQKQMVTQNMIQAVEILQMSAQELSDYMKELSLENPVVEIEESQPEDKQEDQLKKLEWLATLDEQNRTWYRYDSEEDQQDRLSNVSVRQGETLQNSLMQQLIAGQYSDMQMKVFEYIALCLDSNGYFTMEPAEVAQQFGVSECFIGECLSVMKSLEPAGVCAGSLKECLLLQLAAMERADGTELYHIEKEIVRQYMELLGKNQLHVIAKKMQAPIERIKEACETIRSLNPRPAQGYDSGERSRYIVPDITIVKLDDRFEILLNDYAYPALHINKEYLQMLRSDCGDEVKEYLHQKVSQVRQVQDCIVRRGSTLLNLARCIVEVQKGFFLFGEQSIRPFRLKDAAQKLDVHESTVSRAIKDKYLQCCWGTYPLSFFFSKGVRQEEEQEAVATFSIKNELRQLIGEEDKKKPYNDQKLSELLTERGFEISRRTVAKYRESMGIPNSRGRREF